MRKYLRLFLPISFFLLVASAKLSAQTTYDFSTNATISGGAAGFGIWNTQANITVDGVNYKLTSGGNGSFTNQGTGGNANSKVLMKDGSGGDVFTIQRNDGLPFKFYGFWVKHQSMNSYAQFYSLPPFYDITYYKSDGSTETYSDNTAMQGGSYTTSSTTFTKDLTVTSVTINFKAIIYYWIDDIRVGIVPVAPAITGNPANRNICAGSNTTFAVTATNATSYQWQVNTGSGFTDLSASATYSGVTTATLSVTGATAAMSGYTYRCVASGTGSATSNAGTLTVRTVTTSGSQSNIPCFGGSNGSATVAPSGGLSPYTFSWSPSGGTGLTASNLSAGTYTVTVTDAGSCQATRSFTITQPASAITATTSQTNVSCYGGSNGTATVSVSGGTPSYIYSWAPSGGTSPTATGLSAGTYTVTITDMNNCSTTKTFTITQPSAALSATTSSTAVSCFGGSNGTATVTASGGTAPYTYSWSPSGGSNATATGLAAGSYTVTVTDNNGCQVTKTVSVTQPTAALSATTATTAVSCYGGANGTASVTASGGTGAYTYSWAPSGGTNATATGLTAGSYTVTITDANSCQITKTITVGQPSAALSATTSKTDVSCNGGTNGTAGVTVSGGTAPYTYSWSPSGGTAATATGLTAGSYTVTITDANSCQITKTITVGEAAAITATATPAATTICSATATSIALTSNTSGASFAWTVTNPSGDVTGASASSGTSIAQTLNGNGQVRYSITPSKSGCTGTATAVTITVRPLTVINSSPSNKSIDEEQNTTFSVTASFATGYQWQVNQGSGFVDISNGAPYSGATTATLSITSATGEMDGYAYRCVASGNCSAGVASGSATLSVRVKATQTISIPATGSATYGDADFAPAASSNSNLAVTFSSSDNNIASIVNGKVHIKKAGEVTITATQAGDNDYKPATPVTQVLTIAKKDIGITFASTPLITKTYDRSKTATVGEENVNIGGLINNDEVSATVEAEYADNKAGENKTINVTALSLSGPDKNNYNLLTTGGTVTGTITRKAISLSISNSVIEKEYDGTKNISLSADKYLLQGVISPDDVSITGTALFVDKNAGMDKTITVGSLVVSGADKNNYQLTTENTTTEGDITPKEVIARFSANPTITKVYDGDASAAPSQQNYQLLGMISGDDVSVSGTAVYADKTAGTKSVTVDNMELSGDDALNYALANTSAVTSGTITPKMLTLSLQQVRMATKLYEVKKDPSLNKVNYTLNGIIGNDEVKLKDPVSSTSMDKSGTPRGSSVNELLLIGADAGNYALDITSIIKTPERAVNSERTSGNQSGSKLSGSEAEKYTMKAWGINHQVLYIKVSSAVPQKAALVVYTEAGAPVVLQQKELTRGVNVFTVPVSSLTRGVYVVGVKGQQFTITQKVRL